MPAPTFDPTQPFEAISTTSAPTFDPTQPFEPVTDAATQEKQAPPQRPLTDRIAELWTSPPKGGLISVVKPIVEGTRGLLQAAGGDKPIIGDDGHTNPEVIQDAWDFANAMPLASAPGGVLARQIGPGLRAPPSTAASVKQSAPAATELKQAAVAGFESPAVKEMTITPGSLGDFALNTRAALNEAGLDDVLAPKIFNILDRLTKAPQGSVVTGSNMQTLRRGLGNAAQSADPVERLAAKKVIDAIDGFMENIPASGLLSGDAKIAGRTLSDARGNYAAAKRSERVDEAKNTAELNASSAGSGGNIDNATRQQFKSILRNDSQGFNESEVAQMEKIVRGTVVGNVARLIGKAAPTGIVSGGLSAGAGLAVGGLPGAIGLPVAGALFKKIGDLSTARQVQILDEMVRSRAPLSNAMTDLARKKMEYDLAQTPRTMAGVTLAARNLANNLRDIGVNLPPAEIAASVRTTARPEQTNPPSQ